MYCSFFGLRCLPFEDRADTQFFHSTSGCQETLTALTYATVRGKGMMLLEGEAGTGKTLLSRTLIRRALGGDHVVVLTWPADGAPDLIRETCKRFGVALPTSYRPVRGLARLRRHLPRLAKGGHRAVLIVDQAENLSPENLEQFADLSELPKGKGGLLRMILVAQPRLKPLLDRPEFARIRRRIFGERRLSPLTPEETGGYIRHRLQVAGAAESDVFEPGAVAVIHEASGGIPRLINRICDTAMGAACRAGQKRIGCDTVLEAAGAGTTKERSADARDVAARPAEVATAAASVATSDWPGGDASGPPWVPRELAPFESGRTPEPIELRTEDPVPSIAYAPSVEESPDGDLAVLAGIETAQTASAPSMERGELMLERLERALARAERMASTHETSVAQYTAVEKHLASLTGSAERITQRLSQSAQQATAALAAVQKRTEQVLDESERRAQGIACKVTRAAEVSENATSQLKRVEDACARADGVEARLTSFAEQLADRADEVQERLALLMNGFASGEVVRDKLQATLDKASTFAVQSDERIEAQRAKLQKTIDEAERFQTRFTDAALERHRKNVESRFETAERTRLEAVETARTTLESMLDRVTEVTADAETKIRSLTCKGQELVEAGESSLNRLAESAVERCRKNLESQLAAGERAHLEAAEAAHGTLAKTLDRVTRATSDADARAASLIERLQNTVSDGVARLSQVGDQVLTNHRNRLREQSERFEGSHFETAEAARKQLEQLLERASSVTTDADARISALRTDLKETVTETQRTQQDVTKNAVVAYRKKLQDDLEAHRQAHRKAIEEAGSEHDTLRDQTAAVIAEAEQTFDAMVGKLNKRVEEAERRAEQRTDTALDQAQQKLETQGESQRKVVEATISAHRARLQGLLDESSVQVRQIDAALLASREKLDEAVSDSERAQEQLIEKTQAEIEQADQHIEAIETRHLNVQSSIVEMGEKLDDASPRVGELTQTIQGVRSSVDELTTRADSTRENLNDAVHRGAELVSKVQSLCGQVDAVQHGVANTLIQIGTACERVSAAREQAHHCEEVTARLELANAGGEQLAAKLDDSVSQGGKLREALVREVGDATEKIGQLDSHNAAARNVLRELSDANATAHRVVKEASDAAGGAKTASTQISELLKSVRSLTTTAEVRTKRLGECSARAEKLIETISHAQEPARERAGELSEFIEKAQGQVRSIADHCAKAGKLVERLGSMRAVLSSATETEASMKQTLEKAQATHRELGSMAQDAAQHGAALRELAASAQNVIQTQQELKSSADVISEHLSGQISVGQTSLKTGKQLLGEFGRQAQDVDQKIEELHRRAAQVEQAVSQATEKPSQLLAIAQTQSAQLEQVCTAVRKVFSGLARASLEARNHTKEFHGASKEAAQRITRLTGETNRASETLREWIEEAVRAQSRLERSLQQCPSIHETHPADDLQAVSTTITPFTRIANPSVSGELDALPEPQADGETRHPMRDREEVVAPPSGDPEQAVAPPSRAAKAAVESPSRAEQITRLIVDAKKSALTKKT